MVDETEERTSRNKGVGSTAAYGSVRQVRRLGQCAIKIPRSPGHDDANKCRKRMSPVPVGLKTRICVSPTSDSEIWHGDFRH